VVPVIVPGVAGAAVETVTVSEPAELVPHALVAVTVKLPLVDPGVTVIELVVDVPVQPVGSVHV
jgi:hypothetical protein